uniref:Uncharacterized protein n=1 Tax=Arion vulgaris TaxID=1028688 RepID=A0A0B6ZNL1_9EUPU
MYHKSKITWELTDSSILLNNETRKMGQRDSQTTAMLHINLSYWEATYMSAILNHNACGTCEVGDGAPVWRRILLIRKTDLPAKISQSSQTITELAAVERTRIMFVLLSKQKIYC